MLSSAISHLNSKQAASKASAAMDWPFLMYYQVAIKVLVDNFAVLGIENCLLNSLLETLSPDTVIKLDEYVISDIAAESEDSLTERARVTKKLKSLESGLQILNRLGRYKPAGRSVSDRAYAVS